MSSLIWKNILGYVIIRVDGYNLESFVNRCTCYGIGIWGIRRISLNSMQVRMLAEDFYRVRKAIRGIGCKVHIIGRQGVPFRLKRKRAVFALGLIAVIIAIFALSRYVWVIEVDGCSRIDEAEILSYIKDLGLDLGTLKSGINTTDIAGDITKRDERIAWTGVEIDGIRLKVNIVETEPQNIVDISTPTSVYAKKDGVIVSVLSNGGKPCVTVGQAVKKGDLLINGNLTSEEGKELLVHASGEVMAKVLYSAEATVYPNMEAVIRTGNLAKHIEIELLGIKLFSRAPFLDYETALRYEKRLAGCVIPVTIRFFDCFELSMGMKTLTEDEMYSRAKAEAQTKLRASIPENVAILSRSVDILKNDDGSITVVISIIAEENIADIKTIG
ncbi:MAG: sporulation protein YqfD [Clostridia bacterium]|nr:sporulation protein YqfD [Clostridia bacterium]